MRFASDEWVGLVLWSFGCLFEAEHPSLYIRPRSLGKLTREACDGRMDREEDFLELFLQGNYIREWLDGRF